MFDFKHPNSVAALIVRWKQRGGGKAALILVCALWFLWPDKLQFSLFIIVGRRTKRPKVVLRHMFIAEMLLQVCGAPIQGKLCPDVFINGSLSVLLGQLGSSSRCASHITSLNPATLAWEVSLRFKNTHLKKKKKLLILLNTHNFN